jgi:iron complex transport system permease protein
MSIRIKVSGMIALIIALMIAFLCIGAELDFDYLIPQRLLRLATIVLGSICLAVSAIVFQTLIGNRILVPSVMGYEAVYLLWQALLLFILGTQGQTLMGNSGSFLVSIILMLTYSWALHAWLLPHCKQDVFMLLLFGLVLTMVLGTATQYIQLSISPGEFSILQGLSYTSFNRANPQTLLLGSIAVILVLWIGYKSLPVLDVMVLGREQSISLGVHHRHYVTLYLALIAVLVAVSTSLIGPTAFMGIFIANMTYALAGHHQHKILLPLGSGIAVIVFLIAQLFVEHFFNYRTSVSILVNLVCGTYFLILIIRSRGTS